MDIKNLLVFVRVVQTGSFTKAASALGMPKSTVSRQVAELEKELGIPLLKRTTRNLKITDVGQIYYEHGLSIATEIEKAEAMVSNLQSVPQGTLKITAAPDLANHFLPKMISQFTRDNPKVKVDLILTERVVDIIGEGFDLALRIGELKDSTLIARKIGTVEGFLFASPTYLKKFGEPQQCVDLKKHDCILFQTEGKDKWNFTGPRTEKSVEVTGKISTNDMSLVKEFAIAGAGIAILPYYLAQNEVKSGKLKPILKEWVALSQPVHVVYPGSRYLLPKVRAFLDELFVSFKDVKWKD